MKPNQILLVDDDPLVSNVVRLVLLRDGLGVETLGDGKVAKERIEAAIRSGNMPDLVILEVSLPFCDGYEVLRHAITVWRQTYGGWQGPGYPPTFRGMFLSAKARDNDVIRGLSLGAVDYVAKPFSAEVLRARVRNVLRCEWRL